MKKNQGCKYTRKKELIEYKTRLEEEKRIKCFFYRSEICLNKSKKGR